MSGHASQAASTYQQQDIQTADPMQLVVRVFQLASLHVGRARTALATGNLSAKGRAVHQASRCLSLLQSSLDLERGGEVAANLDRLYAYLLRRLTEAHLRNDETAFAEISTHLGELGTAWREASSRKPARGDTDTAEEPR